MHENGVFGKRRQNLSHTSYVFRDKVFTLAEILLALVSFGSVFETITKQGLHSVVEKTLPKRTAFTLAEVLIVLGIIGLIADMTIPTLISSTQEKIAVTRLKKAHSTFESAYRLAVQENGTPENWDLKGMSSSEGALNILNTVKPYLRLIKDCGTTNDCIPQSGYKYLRGGLFAEYSSNQFAKAQLADGTIIFVGARNKDCEMVRGESPALKETCGVIDMDINGLNPPNQYGRDVFSFIITKTGIIPQGTQGDTYVKFDENCKDKSTATGWGCTAWVLYNGNMDYMHCNDLSWDGKNRCE